MSHEKSIVMKNEMKNTLWFFVNHSYSYNVSRHAEQFQSPILLFISYTKLCFIHSIVQTQTVLEQNKMNYVYSVCEI